MFLIFIAFNLACFTLGYIAHQRGWAPERWSRPMHLHTVIWLWSPVSLFAFWGLPMNGEAARDVAVLMLAQPVLMVLAAAVMAPAAIWIGCTREQRGTMVLAAALSNHGFTIGAYLCYALLDPPGDALSYGIAYVTSMQVFMILIFYPVAMHYSPEPSGSLGRLIVGSFLTIRATPLYASLVGIALNLGGVGEAVPERMVEWHLMDVLFFAGAAGAYGGNGLRFRFTGSWEAIRMHGLLGAVQFIAHPVLALGLVMGLGMAGAIGPLPRDVILVQAFMPTALNTVIVANLFHLDARLASMLWLWNTLLFCVVPLPLLLWWY